MVVYNNKGGSCQRCARAELGLDTRIRREAVTAYMHAPGDRVTVRHVDDVDEDVNHHSLTLVHPVPWCLQPEVRLVAHVDNVGRWCCCRCHECV